MVSEVSYAGNTPCSDNPPLAHMYPSRVMLLISPTTAGSPRTSLVSIAISNKILIE